MKTMTITGRSSLSLLLFIAGLLSFAAPKASADEEKDPPTRVARISYLDGSVSLQPGGQGDWGAAAKNRPVTIGDKLWVDKDSRAELQAGTVSIHLGSMTALSFLNLDEGITQMRLAEGSVNFRVSELREGDLVEVDAPNMAFTVKQAGAFRIDVDESGDSARVTAIRGEGEVTAGGKTFPVHAEERGEFTGTENNIQSHFERAPGPDGLDHWADERDRKEDNSVSGKYVSKDMDGYSDLDENGTWQNEPEYGHVWYPNEVAPDWAPYSYGSWNYVGPWGWTWVGYEPWGFAPYHYGRWAFIGSRWGWCPGAFYGPAIYGPAFVGFFGGGFGFGVGWFPLGWGEPFFPWYHSRGGYIRNINIHNTYIRNVNVFSSRNFNYAYAHNVRAVTTANRNAFTNGQLINRGASGRVTEASLRGAHVTNSVGIKPTEHSALGSVNVRSHVATPPAAVQNRAVVARTAPAQAASHVPVHTVNSARLAPGRTGAANAPSHNAAATPGMNGRQQGLSESRPPSAATNSNHPSGAVAGNTGSQHAGNNARTWEAQGNTSDRGRPPAGFGSSTRSENSPAQSARNNEANRPPWARQGAQSSGPNGQASRPSSPNYNSNRSNNNGRSYSPPPTRSYSAPRTYSAPSRSYPAPSRPSAPSHSAPSHSYSAPSHTSGGGGSRGGGGGGSPHGGGGSHGHR
ncbi:MAG TPA: DUF6600 domain-containing protein [Candidatus Cybelea sp.]|nr:DUF6600 domain-containing protein [Candidatus Cybelea sp.]